MQVKNVSVNLIKPYEKNPRKNNAAVDKVAASLKEFGFKQPIVTDKDGIIIAGHTRYKAALKLGLTEVPVLYAEDLTPEQVQAYRLADNKTSEFAEWDMDMLAGELVGIGDMFTGFSDDEIVKILSCPEALDLDGLDNQTAISDAKTCHCPKCGFEFEAPK
jgi:hypothetical protein